MKIRLKLMSIIFIVALSLTANADLVKNNKIKIDNQEFTVKQYKSLLREKKMSLPIIDCFSIDYALKKISNNDFDLPRDFEKIRLDGKKLAIFIIKDNLRILGYLLELPSAQENDSLTQAIKDYQEARGYKPTGILLMNEGQELISISNAFKPAKVLIPDSKKKFKLSIGSDGNVFFSASGVMRPQNQKNDSSTLIVTIECNKIGKFCLKTTNLFEKLDEFNRYELKIVSQYYQIEEWDHENIVAITADSESRFLLFIPLAIERVYLSIIPNEIAKKQIPFSYKNKILFEKYDFELVDRDIEYPKENIADIKKALMSPKYIQACKEALK